MSTDIVDEPLSTSYDFYDAKDAIILTLYANGAFEVKDFDISIETDSIEIRTLANERWLFQLWEHIYSDRSEIETTINSAQTQTSIEIRLIKQQPRKIWPQLYSFGSTPITPQRDDPFNDFEDTNMIDQQQYDLSMKKLKHDYFESNTVFTSHIYIKQVQNCQVHFTETNFTAIFQTNDEQFLIAHSITFDKLIRLFVRVKERIIPNKCSFRITPTVIEISLVKDNPNSTKWGRLEPSEYSETRPSKQQTLPSTPPSSPVSTPSTNANSNKAIPLPPPPPPLPLSSMDRKSDKYPSASAFASSIQQQEDTFKPTSSSSLIGFTGIHNPANSCFMNAAVQCLANARELRDYFLQSHHSSELNRTNPLGMKGAMAEEFNNVIKNLWTGKYNYINGNRLRAFAAQRHQEFVGNGQHDAQELLTILLDAVHEDLNRVTTKPQVPPVEDQCRPDNIVADEYWRGYLSRNDSIIVQLFTGQFKSKTKCPQCHKESVTFDPFTSLSVPIPKRTAVDTIVTYRSDEKPPTKYRIIISADGLIHEFKSLLSAKCGLPTNKMIAYKIRGNRTVEHLKDNDRASSTGSSWNNNDIIYVTETLTSAECNNEPIVRLTFIQRVFKLHEYVSPCGYCQAPPNPHSASKFCINCYQVSYCDDVCQKLHSTEHKNYCGFRSTENYEVIGIPFIISLPDSKLTCENVFEQISIYDKRSVDIHIERSKRTQRSLPSNDDYDRINSDLDEEDCNVDDDTFSDIENVDWPTIKNTLSSSDSWSICRLGDYFVKTGKNKRRRHQEKLIRKEKLLKNSNTNDEAMISNSDSSTEEFDMLDDIYGNQPLFRLMPQTSNNTNINIRPIVEPGDDADKILRHNTTFSIDWFTDNKAEAPLRVIPSKNRHGINGLIEDDSVLDSSCGDQDISLQQCLQMFIEPEVLGPDDKWYCPYCKEHMQAEKKMSVWRLPPILIIQLKRFKYYHGSSFGYLSDSRIKIDTNVKFPVHDLNMNPYCSSTTDSSQSRYDLFGIINHRGSAWFGHYTSYARLLAYNDSAKSEIGWRNFDDEHVSSLPHDKDLVRSDAYVLFYRHRHLPVNFVINQQNPSPVSMDTYEDTIESHHVKDTLTMEASHMNDINDLLK